MRISDWSSDVCSSDLCARRNRDAAERGVSGRAAQMMAEWRLQPQHFLHEIRDEFWLRAQGLLQCRVVGQDADRIAKQARRRLTARREQDMENRPAFGYAQRRSEEHTSELHSLMLSSYAVFCLTKTPH